MNMMKMMYENRYFTQLCPQPTYVRCLDDNADPGGLQGLGDRHGNLFGQPLLNCGETRAGLDRANNIQAERVKQRH